MHIRNFPSMQDMAIEAEATLNNLTGEEYSNSKLNQDMSDFQPFSKPFAELDEEEEAPI